MFKPCQTTVTTTSETSKTSDMVNHPPHYTSHPSGVEAITAAEHCSNNLGNAFKYLFRFTSSQPKSGSPNIEDLKKARWYIDREIKRLD